MNQEKDNLICRWYCIEYIDKNKWRYQSNCGEDVIISGHTKLYKYINKEGWQPCPKCGVRMTVGEAIL